MWRRIILRVPLVLFLASPACEHSFSVGPPEPLPPWNGYRAAFTFSSDDNNADNLVWADVFRRHGVRYTLFVVPSWVGDPTKLSVDDINMLHEQGFEIAGHGHSHVPFTTLDDLTLMEEIVGCRDSLEALIEDPEYRCKTLAYPLHDHDDRVIAMVDDYYIAARNGGTSSQGWPGFSQGKATWDELALYEVPLSATVKHLTEQNTLSEVHTRERIRSLIQAAKDKQIWINIYAHWLDREPAQIDADHLEWILEELLADGGIWIATFGEVSAYYRKALEQRVATP